MRGPRILGRIIYFHIPSSLPPKFNRMMEAVQAPGDLPAAESVPRQCRGTVWRSTKPHAKIDHQAIKPARRRLNPGEVRGQCPHLERF